MRDTLIVYRHQLNLFKQEKGMLIFYLIAILILGIAVPFLFSSLQAVLPTITLLTISYLKPILSSSFTGEREGKTLESLLASPLNGKKIFLGKVLFSLSFSMSFFALTLICAVITLLLLDRPLSLSLFQLSMVVIFSILTFTITCMIGVYQSAKAPNTLIVNRKVSISTYLLGLLLIIYFSIIFLDDLMVTFVVSLSLLLIDIVLFIIYGFKMVHMKQWDYYENVKPISSKKKHHVTLLNYSCTSPFCAVVCHEIKYLWTLKTLLFNFLILTIAPATVFCLLKYYTGKFDLNYAVLLTIFMMPRVPTNLISYSIGGEKTYKTGESLLATPLKLHAIFLAKCLIPIIVSLVMLIFSSILTLAVVPLYTFISSEPMIHLSYTPTQLLLLYPVNIMTCTTMIFATAILMLTSKTPRQGLYISTVLGPLFLIPPALFCYVTSHTFVWSLIYLSILVVFNLIVLLWLNQKINRSLIMSKL